MTSSPEYQRFAELYYQRHLPVVAVSRNHIRGRVVFEENGSKIEVTGNNADFLTTLKNLIPSNRDGNVRYIDVRNTQSGDLQTYSRNLQYFDSEYESLREATISINNGELTIPSEFDANEALDSSIRLDFDNEELEKLIKNYVGLMAVTQSNANKMNQPFKKYRDNASYDGDRFGDLYKKAVELFQDVYLNGPPFECYKNWRETNETDLLNFAQKVRDLKKRKEIEWDGLKHREIDLVNNKPYLEFWDTKSESAEKSAIEGEMGVERILEQYSSLFELAQEPLRDLAAALDDSGEANLTDMGKVLAFLDANDEQSIAESIEPQLRHGSSHESINCDDSEGILRIYDGRGKSRKKIKELDYREIPPAYYYLSDMVAALLFAINRVNDRVVLQYMDSGEFISRMSENIPPEQFSD